MKEDAGWKVAAAAKLLHRSIANLAIWKRNIRCSFCVAELIMLSL